MSHWVLNTSQTLPPYCVIKEVLYISSCHSYYFQDYVNQCFQVFPIKHSKLRLLLLICIRCGKCLAIEHWMLILAYCIDDRAFHDMTYWGKIINRCFLRRWNVAHLFKIVTKWLYGPWWHTQLTQSEWHMTYRQLWATDQWLKHTSNTFPEDKLQHLLFSAPDELLICSVCPQVAW